MGIGAAALGDGAAGSAARKEPPLAMAPASPAAHTKRSAGVIEKKECIAIPVIRKQPLNSGGGTDDEHTSVSPKQGI
jgi:hypothetical protein